MREIFPRESAENPEPFTGERFTASVQGQIELEHYHRYLFSRGFCRDRDVLDVASGEGYGAAQLAQVARQVTGVEYAGPTAHNAARNFPRANLCFVQADARSLPVANASIDVVTSFETIEHFDRQEDFVAEVRRVLRADGCFIVSTPDRDIYSPPGSTPNPFHVHEFDRAEFLDLLHRYFRYVSLIRQRPMLASALIPEEPASIAPLVFERAEDAAFASDVALPGAPYLIAIASEGVPKLAPVSLLIERSEADNVRSADQEAELVRLRMSETKAREEAETERHAAEGERETTRDAVAAARKAVEQAQADAMAAAVTLTHTRAALVEANTELELLSHSLWYFLRQYLLRIWRRFVH